MEAILDILGLLLAIAAVLPWIRQGDWWIRVFDFPRLQLAGGGIGVLLGYRFVTSSTWAYAVQLMVVFATLYQLNRIRPFTRFGPKQVQSADASDRHVGRLRVMIANVWMPNRRADRLIALVRRYEPDILLAVETDDWWASELKSLEQTHPYTVFHPLPNTYGMLLFSRYRLIGPEVRCLIEDGVPSIAAGVQLPDGTRLHFQALHPRPPRPTKRQDSSNRDAELMIVGEQIAEEKGPTIVAGDLNDVAWSYTTDLFQRISGLLDPRRGRGMYNSFHARIPLLRFPLDHIFHSDHFRVMRLERLEKFGSDHFPLFIELSVQGSAARTQDTPEADSEDRKLARELRARAGSATEHKPAG